MVKYTGFGNAAGHLAQKGLMGGGRGPAYSSSSDSDTEEYREAEPHIDPVVGCTRPPRNNPWEGMTDEQVSGDTLATYTRIAISSSPRIRRKVRS